MFSYLIKLGEENTMTTGMITQNTGLACKKNPLVLLLRTWLKYTICQHITLDTILYKEGLQSARKKL